MGYTICILAQQGASSGDDPRDGARSGVPRLRREPHRREVRIPTARPSRLGAGSRCGSGPTAGSRLRGSASENRHGGAPREVPVAPGQGVARRRRDRKNECGLSALHHPSSGGRNCCCRDGRWCRSPRGLAGGRESEGTCEETDKPGRSNAPRERRTLRETERRRAAREPPHLRGGEAAVSKDGAATGRASCFETLAALAPQHEDAREGACVGCLNLRALHLRVEEKKCGQYSPLPVRTPRSASGDTPSGRPSASVTPITE